VPISLAGAAVGLPTLLASAISAVFIAASLPGKVHPPTVCIPLAITAPSIQLVALIGRWVCFTGLALVCLAVLWLLTAPRLAQGHRVVARDGETPCPAES
jgi:protein-S-isoprenylcysteine O-methyltransferase Ste14